MVANMSIPTLSTARLLLRAHTAGDFYAASRMWADPEFVRFIGGEPRSRTTTWQSMLALNGLWSICGYGYWTVEDKATHSFIGQIGFADFKRELDPEPPETPEMGWVIDQGFSGQGLASEGSEAALQWLDSNGFDAAHCLINRDNAASLRIAQKLGFRESAVVQQGSGQSLLLQRQRA